MDILDIDAVNFAGRVAHVAAAELAGLLVHGEVAPIGAWFAGDAIEPGTDLSADVDMMAAYVVRRQAGGEQLYRSRRIGDWAQETPEIRAAFELFSSTAQTVAAQLLERQRAAEHALELATRPAPAPVKLEDTIFEPEESLGTLRPEAVEAAGQIATYDAARKAERAARRRQLAAEKRAAAAKAEHDAAAANLKRTPAPAGLEPMSVGEAPAKPPVNRGGRGRRKEK